MLRHSSSISTFEELGEGSKFKPVIGHINFDNLENCESVILCSGKYVYDVEAAIKEKNSTKTALFTIEELFPFPEA